MRYAVDFLDSIAGYTRATHSNGSADRTIRLALVDPAYSPTSAPYPAGIPAARVTFEGEGTMSGKYYAVAAGFVPSPGQRVWLVPMGTTYLIAGAATHTTAQGFYSDAGGGNHGVELGGGSYFDTVEGLQLDTDADIAGALNVGETLTVGGKRVIENEKLLFTNAVAYNNATTSFTTVTAASTLSFTKLYSSTVSKLIVTMKLSARITVGTAPAISEMAVLINSSDTLMDTVVYATVQTRMAYVGVREVLSLPASTYSITPRLRVTTAHTVTTDTNDRISIHVREVPL